MDNFWKSDHDLESYLSKVRSFIEDITPVADENWKIFSECLIFKKYEKGEVITAIGQVENHMYFLLKGAAMMCYFDKGHDHVIRFYFPGSFFNSFQSYITNKSSLHRIEALEKTSVFSISRSDMDQTFNKIENAWMVSKKITEISLSHKEQREISFLSKTAEENYFDLIKDDPDIHNYVPLKHIASYLGVAPESLSRIRQRNNSNNK